MNIAVGIGLAFVAMLCWGFGDFLIQKSTRKIGDWETLFIITGFGAIVLFPFVASSIYEVFISGPFEILVLSAASVLIFFAALFDFEALKEGKLAIVEPILSLEVPVSAVLAFLLIQERITTVQLVLIILLLISLILVSFREKKISKKFFMEKGALIAIGGAVVMGCANFFMGWGGRLSDPLMIMFLSNTFIMVVTGIYIIWNGRLAKLAGDLRSRVQTWLPMSISDNVAWIAFVFAMSLAPIAVVTALSESYIIVAVLLGLSINKEKLQRHQKIGLLGAFIIALSLALVTVQ